MPIRIISIVASVLMIAPAKMDPTIEIDASKYL